MKRIPFISLLSLAVSSSFLFSEEKPPSLHVMPVLASWVITLPVAAVLAGLFFLLVTNLARREDPESGCFAAHLAEVVLL